MTANPSSSTSAPVPPYGEIKRKPRTLVLCFYGTGNEYDDTVSLYPHDLPFPSLRHNRCAAVMSHRIRMWSSCIQL